eukprot:scaffold10345_cov158-Cylindrotheca_fusiformis.AAC.2
MAITRLLKIFAIALCSLRLLLEKKAVASRNTSLSKKQVARMSHDLRQEYYFPFRADLITGVTRHSVSLGGYVLLNYEG